MGQQFTTGTAVVTGGGSGIGEGLVRYLAGRGMHAVVADLAEDRAEQVAADIRQGGGSATAARVDVADYDSVEALAERVYAEHGSVELLVNNAGLESGGRLWTVDPERWRLVNAVNLDGVFHGVRAFVPRMLAQGSASAVANVSSIGAVTTPIKQGVYVSTKHAVLALSEVLYRELAEEGADIQVSVLMPNMVRSRIFSDAQQADQSSDAEAAEFLERMRQVIDEGLEPIEAAEQMVAKMMRDEFWVTVGPRCDELIQARAEHLMNLTAPIGNVAAKDGQPLVSR